ncbi:MAG: hypothetical protein QOC77_1918 [Thermoleophilaceae bacterium]|jgi:uncharacterized membrane protein YdbT with pleckstrin-like domain|nr:hypothetical protein [Thermoleophilaceae bacterium]MEA2470664.1 hypothetical protein [Thermoleophilaceae bacterium]
MELHPGENIIYEGHPSWRSIVGFYLVGVLLVAAAAVIGALAGQGGIGAGAAGVILVVVLIVGWLKRITTRYLITNRRLQIRRGLIAKHVEETRTERVVDVTVRQGVLDRILQIGAVDFDNASSQQGDLFRFAGVAQPERLVRAIDMVHEEARSSPVASQE